MKSLFDNYDETENDEWQEVPQARFLSWSYAMQLAYCEARDINSATYADTPEAAQWYLDRAKSYREECQRLKGPQTTQG